MKHKIHDNSVLRSKIIFMRYATVISISIDNDLLINLASNSTEK